MTEPIWEKGYTQNRELSWLQFNARVLEEAEDETVPLLERVKFLSIFTSNLDEFYMIRVGSLGDVAALGGHGVDNKSGLTAKEQLERIYAATAPLYERRDRVFRRVERELGAEGLQRLRMSELTQDEHHYIRQLFRTAIQPLLSPQIVDAHHPFPHLASKTLHVGVRLSRKKSEFWGLIPMPPSVPELLFLPEQNGICRYVPLEEVLLFYADSVFEMYSTLEKVVFCVTRNADINPDDEPFAPDGREIDLRAKMEKLLRERRRLCVVRVELSAPISGHFAELFRKRFDISGEQIFVSCEAPLRMDYAFSLGEHLPEARRAALSDPPFTPQQPAMLLPGQSLLRAALKRDLFLSYPYESMEPFLQMVREAANAPDVLSIRITIYRLARKAKLVDYLCAAAENGKDVTVLIELRARFDEQNNIDWSERLEEAGCKVLYGFEDYKVHSKICLITLRERGALRHVTQIGTGNYNEKTAKQYTDVSLVTADQNIGADAAAFFKQHGAWKSGGQLWHAARCAAPAEEADPRTHRGTDSPRPKRLHSDEVQFSDGYRRHPRPVARLAGGRPRRAHHPRHLLPRPRRAGLYGQHHRHEHRWPLSGAFPHLLLRPRRAGARLYLVCRHDDAQHRPPRGDRLSHSQPGDSPQAPRNSGRHAGGYRQGARPAAGRNVYEKATFL